MKILWASCPKRHGYETSVKSVPHSGLKVPFLYNQRVGFDELKVLHHHPGPDVYDSMNSKQTSIFKRHEVARGGF